METLKESTEVEKSLKTDKEKYPPFSVLIALYEKEKPHLLNKALHSVFNQTVVLDEVVLVLDGKLTDELLQIVEHYKSTYNTLKIVQLPEKKGLGIALSEGLQHCSYELVARMDTDDVSMPNRFEKLLQVFIDKPEISVVSSWITEVNQKGNVIGIKTVPETHQEIQKLMSIRQSVNHPASMFKKSAVLAAGNYRHFHRFEDYELWFRMLDKGFLFYNIQESLYEFYCDNAAISRRGGLEYAKSEIRLMKYLRKKHFISWYQYVLNLVLRIPVRFLPTSIRSLIYKLLLRS
ncbi:glycosyl transferase [Bacteroidia bacterium]|nr:glycosyl transferase [Bacteroidia bacterium]